jgi:hypothetical protein
MEQQKEREEIKHFDYFLQQGKSIQNLQDILNRDTFTHHLRGGFSIVLEVVLFMAVVFIVFIVVRIPSDLFHAKITPYDGTHMIMYNDTLSELLVAGKVILLGMSLIPLFLIVLLRRNRKKSKRIYSAFLEVTQMKKRFEEELRMSSIYRRN